MADKRRLLLEVDVDADSKPLRELGDAAEGAEDDLDDLNRGLKKLDVQAEFTKHQIADLRREISKTGDLGLVKDLQRAEKDLRKLDKDRKSLNPLGDNAGGKAAEEFVLQYADRLGPLMAKAPLSGTGVVIGGILAAAAAPVIGGAIAAAFAGVGGGAGIAAGIALAAKNPAVKSAAADLKQMISSELLQAAQPFVPEVIKQISTIRNGFAPIRDDIADIFRATSKMLTPLTDGGLSGITRIVEGIKSITTSATGAGPVIREIGIAFGIIGDAIGDAFEDLSDNGDEAAGVIRILAYAIADVIRFVGEFANVTSNAVRPLLDFGIAATNVGKAFYGWIPGVGGYLDGLQDRLLSVKGAMDNNASSAVADAVAMREVGSAAFTAAQMVDLLTSAQDRNADSALSAWEANIRYKQSLDAAREAADKKRGVSVAEENALHALAVATNTSTKALDDSGASASQVEAKYRAATAAFINTAVKMGYTREQAARLSDEVLKMPRTKAIQILLNDQEAIARTRNIQRAITNVRGKTVYVNVIQSGNFGAGPNDPGAMHGPSRRALGGPVRAGEPYIVGEKRAELFVPDQNGVIVPNLDDLKSSNRPGLGKNAAAMPPIHVTVHAGYVVTPAQLEAIIGKTVNNIIRKGKLDAVRT